MSKYIYRRYPTAYAVVEENGVVRELTREEVVRDPGMQRAQLHEKLDLLRTLDHEFEPDSDICRHCGLSAEALEDGMAVSHCPGSRA